MNFSFNYCVDVKIHFDLLTRESESNVVANSVSVYHHPDSVTLLSLRNVRKVTFIENAAVFRTVNQLRDAANVPVGN